MNTEVGVLRRSEVLVSAIPIVAFVLLTAIASRVVIPLSFTPVPVTMQVFAVILSGLVLGSKKAAYAQLSFLALIAIGVPLTAYGLSGPLAFVSPTAGYLIAFVPAAYIAGLIAENTNSKVKYALAGLAGLVIVYLLGTSWLAVYLKDAAKAFRLGVVPFVLIDFFKVAIAVSIAGGAKVLFSKE